MQQGPRENPNGPYPNRERGFTLLELAVAIAVITIVMAGLAAMISRGINLEKSTNHFQRATRAANAALENIRGLSWPDLQTSLGTDPVTTTNWRDNMTSIAETSGTRLSADDFNVHLSFPVEGLERADGSNAGMVTFFTEKGFQTAMGLANVHCTDDTIANQTTQPDGTFTVYPIRIRITWRDSGMGNATNTEQSTEIVTVLFPLGDL